eukprot:3913219-Pleurochrysis_carterae.AAC.2
MEFHRPVALILGTIAISLTPLCTSLLGRYVPNYRINHYIQFLRVVCFRRLRAPRLRLDTSFICLPCCDSHLLPDPVATVSGNSSFSAFHTQSISIALHSAVARQIAVYADYVVPSSP